MKKDTVIRDNEKKDDAYSDKEERAIQSQDNRVCLTVCVCVCASMFISTHEIVIYAYKPNPKNC